MVIPSSPGADQARAASIQDRVFELLELPKVLAALREETVSPLGAAAASALRPGDDPAWVAAALAETTEARAVLEQQGPFPLAGLPDLSPRLAALRVEGAVLPAPELIDILHAVEVAISMRRALRAAARSPLPEHPAEPAVSRESRSAAASRPEAPAGSGYPGHPAPRLVALAEQLTELPHLAADIRRAIGPQYEILDDASPELARIRAEKERVRGQVRAQLERLLADETLAPIIQDRLITQRNDRYVIPVKTNHRGLLQGVVHDQSQSRATYFLEPLAVIDANNQLALLREREKEEEWRVLAELSAAARRHRDALATNQVILTHLDLAQAKARLSQRLGGTEPRLVPPAGGPAGGQRGLALRGARHPLLLLQAEAAAAAGQPARPVEPVDIVLAPEVRTVLISGANAGGKTVTLKTLGLLVLMAQAGLHIPASPESELPVFRRVFAEIGDEQAIEEGTSSFSAHLLGLSRILREADGGSLVLLDELGTGTDPEEGSALAIAVLDRLRAQGALAVATTHLAPLKAYAYGREGAQNVAVEFDPKSLRPTYRLLYDASGQSNALSIARALNFPADVIAGAEALLAGGGSHAAALLRDIEKARRRAAAELRRVERLRQRAAEAARRQERVEADLRARREKILAQAREAAGRTVAEAEAEMRRALDRLKAAAAGGAVAPHIVADAKGAVRRARERLVEALRPGAGPLHEAAVRGHPGRSAGGEADSGEATGGPEGAPLAPGVRVRVASLGREGTVLAVDATAGQADVAFGVLKLRVPLAGLTRIGGRPPVPAARRESGGGVRVEAASAESAGPREINVIGLRVDEALPVVDKSLDDALLAGQSRLAIVHGTGTGRLREAIREFLRGHRAVRGVAGGDPAHGGAGVTFVELGG